MSPPPSSAANAAQQKQQELVAAALLTALAAALVAWRHLVTWKLAVTLAAVCFGFGEAAVELAQERLFGTAPPAAEAAVAARGVAIGDDATRELIARLSRLEWRVSVKVERARRLCAGDTWFGDTWFGGGASSDPYVRVELGDVVHRTSTVKQRLDPVWNECFEFELGSRRGGASLEDSVKLGV